MKKFLTGLIAIVALGCSVAQSLSPSVIGITGGSFSSAKGTLEWTLGETVTETYKTSLNFFTQGFHQPIPILNDDGDRITVYPIPSSSFLYVKTPKVGSYHLEVFDLHGKRLISVTSTAV